MASIGTVSVPGKSGKKYNFEIYNYGSNWSDVAGIYIVASSSPNKSGGTEYTPIYVGETDNLQNRFTNHHKESCFNRHHPSHLLWLGEGSGITRKNIEQDIITMWKPVCND